MKKLLASALSGAMVLTLAGCGGSGGGDRPFEGQELHLYNWGEYMGENLIADFEEQTGATVKVDYFDSNEQMYIRVANGESFDVLVPSDYMIQRLMEEDLLQPLDKSKLSNLDLLNDDVMGLDTTRRMNIRFRISGERSASSMTRPRSAKKIWKRKATTSSWIRNTKGISTCMIQSVTAS